MVEALAKQALEAILREEQDDYGEAELLKWATSDKDILYAAYQRSHMNLLRIGCKKLKLQHRFETRG